jgi:hypothetical protein
MCNYTLKSGRLCLIKHKKNDFCHIHFNIQANNEVKNQTKLIKSNQYLKQEIKNLNNTINKITKLANSRLEACEAMKEDYNNYQIIKQYEKEKNELINKGIDIYNYYNNDFHEKRYQRNVLAHAY